MAINQTKKPENTENWSNNPNWANWNWNSWTNMFQNPVDLNKLRNTTSKNIEAVSAANQVALESLQTISRKTAETIQQNARQSVECCREACNSKNPNEAYSRQADYFNNFLQNCFNNSKEVAEIASKAAAEVIEICNNRMNEATRELCNK
jgi:phasin family protein